MERKQFTFYRSYYEAISRLPVTKRGKLLDMIVRYALDGDEPEHLSGEQHMVFSLIKPTLEASRKKAEALLREAAPDTAGNPPGNPEVTSPKGEGEKEKEKKKEKNIKNKIYIQKESETEAVDKEDIDFRIFVVRVQEFAKFFDLFPRKDNREQALGIWKRKNLTLDQVLPGLRRWLASSRWRAKNGLEIPDAVKFLEEEMYNRIPESEDMVAIGDLLKGVIV